LLLQQPADVEILVVLIPPLLLLLLLRLLVGGRLLPGIMACAEPHLGVLMLLM
jgi:hypothetical protein